MLAGENLRIAFRALWANKMRSILTTLGIEHRRKVAVIGQEVVDELRLGANAVGREIYVGTLPATVIGVMEERGQFVGQNIDDLVFIPFQTSLQLFGRRAADQVQLRMQAASAEVTDWPAAHVPWWAVAVAFGFSALVGIFFASTGPAKRLGSTLLGLRSLSRGGRSASPGVTDSSDNHRPAGHYLPRGHP